MASNLRAIYTVGIDLGHWERSAVKHLGLVLTFDPHKPQSNMKLFETDFAWFEAIGVSIAGRSTFFRTRSFRDAHRI